MRPPSVDRSSVSVSVNQSEEPQSTMRSDAFNRAFSARSSSTFSASGTELQGTRTGVS